ncbi:hypothetical protein E2C01_072592 [Portunus trituberculatus]|uniref:Uncharacterized protein n=1 Tax=Portunus trituberculatus TaxID=210409 RepID=A0A5B7IBR6_PORTR|nr:hypothetical protein [Portunus trituberculatus]
MHVTWVFKGKLHCDVSEEEVEEEEEEEKGYLCKIFKG